MSISKSYQNLQIIKTPSISKTKSFRSLISKRLLTNKNKAMSLNIKRDVMYILKTTFQENNFPEDYTIQDNDEKKFIVTFDNEDAAMCFTKKLNLEKIKNPTYKETIVTLTLVPNSNFVPEKRIKKKKGLPLDSIERLFKGESIISSNQNKTKPKNVKKLYISRDSPMYQNDVKSKI